MYCNPIQYVPQKRAINLTRPAARIKVKRKANYIPIPPSAEKVDLIISTICVHFNVTLTELKTPSRITELTDIRKFMYYFIKRYEHRASLGYIGKIFNRDHSTIIHGISTFNNLVETDFIFKLNKEQINDKLKELKEPPLNSTPTRTKN